MYQKRERPKRMDSTFVRTISQHFENFVVDKSNCKCSTQDLDQLENVHLVKSRRQLFEKGQVANSGPYETSNGSKAWNARSSHARKERNVENYENINVKKNLNSLNNVVGKNTLGLGINKVNDSNIPTVNNGQVLTVHNVHPNLTVENSESSRIVPRKKCITRKTGVESDIDKQALNYTNSSDQLRNDEKCDSETSRSSSLSSRSEKSILKREDDSEANVESYRSFVINSIIEVFNSKSDNNLEDIKFVDKEETENMENCEEVLFEMIRKEERKSIYALTLAHKFIKNLPRRTIRKYSREKEEVSEYTGSDENMENLNNISTRQSRSLQDVISEKYDINSIHSNEEENRDTDVTDSASSCSTNDSDSVFDYSISINTPYVSDIRERAHESMECDATSHLNEPVLVKYRTYTDTEINESEIINESSEIINRAINSIVSVGESTDGSYYQNLDANIMYDERDNYELRKTKLSRSRFNRIELHRRKRSYKKSSPANASDPISTHSYMKDDEDVFGSMLCDNDEYCLEVINADPHVVLNKISVQRVCVTNILLHNTPRRATERTLSVCGKKNSIESLNTENLQYVQNQNRDNATTTSICANSDVDECETFHSDPTVNGRTTIYYDHNSNPRIEKPDDASDRLKIIVDINVNTAIPPLSPTIPNRRQNLIIKELLETENTFLEGLRIAIEEYWEHFKQAPDKANSKMRFVFGNSEEIYREAQKFYIDLSTCNYDVEKVALTFLNNKNLFDLYVNYIRNKPISQVYSNGMFRNMIKERHGQLNNRQHLESYLLTPIQRLGRYILLLENLQKVLKTTHSTSELLNEAIDFLKGEMRRADTLVATDSIRNCPHDLTKKGAFLAKENFNIRKKYKSVVFLFEHIVVFTVQNQSSVDRYIYKDSIRMSDLNIRTTQDQPLVFSLRNFSRCKVYQESPHNFELEAASEKIKKKWVTEIEILLWNQLHKFKENQSALNKKRLYQKRKKAVQATTSSPDYAKRQREPGTSPIQRTLSQERQSVFYV